MKRIATALALVLATVVAVPAFAGEHGGKDAFPMKADVFQTKVDARLARGRARIEKRIVEKKVDATKAKEMRDRFEVRASKVRAAAAEAEKDGIVTLDEARLVREVGGHHRHQPKQG